MATPLWEEVAAVGSGARLAAALVAVRLEALHSALLLAALDLVHQQPLGLVLQLLVQGSVQARLVSNSSLRRKLVALADSAVVPRLHSASSNQHRPVHLEPHLQPLVVVAEA